MPKDVVGDNSSNVLEGEVLPAVHVRSGRLGLHDLQEVLHISQRNVPKGFLDCCNRIILLLDKERLAQNKRPLGPLEKIILINEMYRTCLEHMGRKRKSGTSYFDDHLCGATELLIELEGMVGLSTVLATLKHDNIEDLADEDKVKEARAAAERAFDDGFQVHGMSAAWVEKRRVQSIEEAGNQAKQSEERRLSGELIDTTNYAADLGLDEVEERGMRELIRNVQTLVGGVTKFRKAKREETAEATFKRLLQVAVEHIRAIYIKLADRAHNTLTIEGHEDRDRQVAIMEETELQYLSLAKILRIRKMVQFFVERCCEFFNKDLLSQFENLAMERRGRLGSKNKGYIKRNIKKIVHPSSDFKITGVEFQDLDLSHYVGLVEKPFKDMTMDDLPIGEFDPMEEILITLDVPDPSRRLAVLSQVAIDIESKFAIKDMAAFNRKMAPVGDPDNMIGMRVVCYDPKYGHLRFRINDRVSEARSKRGVLADDASQSTPEDVRAMIGVILNNKLRHFHGYAGVKIIAADELLKPRIEVFTPTGEIKRLPRNSTGLDFAAAVHGELLVRMKGLSALSGMTSMDPKMSVDPFAHLKDGQVYIVETYENDSQSEVKPEWLLFANTIAAQMIRGHLTKLDDAEGRGCEYLQRLADVFNVGLDELINVIRKKFASQNNRTGKSLNQICSEVANGVLNPVAIFADYLNFRNNRWENGIKNRKYWQDLRDEGVSDEDIGRQMEMEIAKISKWEIEVSLPERAGSLRNFSEEFSAEVGIKIDQIKAHTPGRDGKPGKLNLVFDLGDNEIDMYDFLTKLVKLNFKYSAKIANPVVNRLADLRNVVE